MRRLAGLIVSCAVGCGGGGSSLISADDSILSFIETADRSPCRLLLHRKKITGIVTVSDLQQLPVRPILFLLVTHVELLMAESIRASGCAEETWINYLEPKRRDAVEKKWSNLVGSNLGIDKLTATEFCDKREILRNVVKLPVGRKKYEKQVGRIEWLRHSLAHAGEYARNRENAERTIEAVKYCTVWNRHLRANLKTDPANP